MRNGTDAKANCNNDMQYDSHHIGSIVTEIIIQVNTPNNRSKKL